MSQIIVYVRTSTDKQDLNTQKLEILEVFTFPWGGKRSLAANTNRSAAVVLMRRHDDTMSPKRPQEHYKNVTGWHQPT